MSQTKRRQKQDETQGQNGGLHQNAGKGQNTKDDPGVNGGAANGPSHIVNFAPARENAPWTRIGAMWPTRNGKGHRMILDFVPNADGDILVMPNTNENAANPYGLGANQSGNQPTHLVQFAPERDNAPWTRVGAMWPTRNAKGHRVTLDFTPISAGDILVLPNEPSSTS